MPSLAQYCQSDITVLIMLKLMLISIYKLKREKFYFLKNSSRKSQISRSVSKKTHFKIVCEIKSKSLNKNNCKNIFLNPNIQVYTAVHLCLLYIYQLQMINEAILQDNKDNPPLAPRLLGLKILVTMSCLTPWDLSAKESF